jgi:RHS repeat-associated protein
MGRRRFSFRWLTVLVVVVLASGELLAPSPTSPSAEAAQEDEEIEELKTETSDTFLNKDGTYTTTLYTEPINYLDQSGEWQAIADEVVPSPDPAYAWTNGANGFDLSFKDALGEGFLGVEVGGHHFDLTLEGAEVSKGSLSGRTVSYPEAFPGVDLAYEVLPEGAAKTLVLKDPSVPTTYRFILSAPKDAVVLAETQDDGSVAVRVAPLAEPAFVLAPPRAAEGGDPDAPAPDGEPHASLAVSEVEGGLAIEVSVDKDWLADPKRAFPVLLDPTITINPSAEDASFSALCGNCTATTADHVYTGTTATTVWRGALKFNLALPTGATITDAKLKTYFDGRCLAGGSGTCGGVAHQVNLHRMTAAWTASSKTNQIAFDPVATSSFTLPVNPALQWMSWPVTTLVQNWYTGFQPNYGVLLKRNSETLNQSGPTPVGKRYTGEPALRPSLVVTYTAEATYLLAPQSLHSNGAELAWAAYSGAPPFTKWEVHRSANPSFTPSATTLLTTIKDVDVTSYTDTTARAGATFTYKVVANAAASNGQTVTLPGGGAGSKALQPDPATGEATYLRYYSGFTSCDNLGSSPSLKVGAEATQKFRPVLSFDLRDIPVGSAITSAQLKLWTDRPPSISATAEVHRVTRDWREGSGNASCTGDGATWYDTEAGILWTAGGGDFDPAVAASAAVTASSDPVWHTFTVTSLVQQWANGDVPNHGMLLKLSDETMSAGRSFSYASDDYADASVLHPKLVINYADGTTVVLPTTSLASHGPGALLTGTVTLKAAAGDDRRVDQVEFLRGTTSLNIDSAPPFEYAWNTTTTSNGTYTLSTKATDDAGNVTTSAGVSVTVHNSAPPTTTASSPSPASATVTVTATASDVPGPVTQVEFYVDGVRFGIDTASPWQASWNTLDPNLPSYDGVHQITSRAYAAGNQVTTSSPVSVTVNNAGSSMYKASITTPTDAVPITMSFDPAAQTQLVYPVDVTVQNTSTTIWTAGRVVLRCRWYRRGLPAYAPDGDPLVPAACPQVSVGALNPTQSTVVRVNVSPPTLGDGFLRADYRLQFDLYDTQSVPPTYFAAKGSPPLDNWVIINKKLMAEALGLERYYQYARGDLGAGWEHLLNVANGNSVIRWTPFTSKGRGLSTVASLTYNSLEEHSRSPAGNNFSLSISSLIPVGTCLDIHPNGSDSLAGRTSRWIEFIDADGTPHHFDETTPNSGIYAEPAGVNLFVRATSDPDGAYAITRPDQVTFFFDADGYPTVVRDRNNNEITFEYENQPSGWCPGATKKRITKVWDPSAQRSFQISYFADNSPDNGRLKGRIQSITDHGGHKLMFEYYKDGNLLRLVQQGGTNANGTFLADRSFVITYMHSDGDYPAIGLRADRENPLATTSPQSTQIFSIRDANAKESTFRYCFPTGDYACGLGGDRAKNNGKLKYRFDRPGEGDEPDPVGEVEPPFTEFAYSISANPTTTTVKAPPAPEVRDTIYTYNSGGQVTNIRDPLLQDTVLAWSTDLALVTLDPPGNPRTEFTYNANGYLTMRRVKVDATTWSETVLAYDNVDALPEPPEDPAEHVSLLRFKTDPNGVATPTPTDDYQWEFQYDANGNLKDVFSPEKDPITNLRYVTHYDWNIDGTLLRTTDARGTKTEFTGYHVSGQPQTIVEAVGLPEARTTTLGYDADGQLVWIRDPEHQDDSGTDEREFKSFFDYDSFHRLARQSTPKSTDLDRGQLIWAMTNYDPNDNVKQLFAPAYGQDDPANGAKTALAYDDMDRMTLMTGPDTSDDPAGERTSWEYDAAGRVTKVTLPKGMKSPAVDDFIVRYEYDALDRVLREIRYDPDPTGSVFRSHNCYDPSGDVVAVTAPRANVTQANCASLPDYTTRYEYTFDHKLKKKTTPYTDDYPAGTVTEYGFDLNRNLITIKDQNLNTETRSYDQRNLLVKVEQPFDVAATNRYVTTKIEYDGMGNKTKLISPRAWDAAGGVNFADFVTSYDYDPLNRLTRTSLPRKDPETQLYVHNGYDKNDNMVCTSLPVDVNVACSDFGIANSSKTTMVYFDPGWIYSSKDPGIPKTRFDYTAEGWQRFRLPAGFPGEQVNWTYFVDGKLKEVHDQANRPASYDYDANNNLELAKDETGVVDDRIITVRAEYDGLDRVTKSKLKTGSEPNWDVTKFTYDLDSNLSTREDNRVEDDQGNQVTAGRKQTFTYDEADWLIDQVDDYATANDCTDDRKIANEFWTPGWEKQRDSFRAGPDCSTNPNHWQIKLTKNWVLFDNGKLKQVTTKNDSGGLVEKHVVDYITEGVYVNGNRVKDTFGLVGPNPANTPCDSFAPLNCSTEFTYDGRDRLTKETKVRDGGSPTDTLYDLDDAGNVTQIQSPTFTRDMTYDGNRLDTVAQAPLPTKKYHYEPDGNLDCITTLSGSPSDCPVPTGMNAPPSLVADYAYDYLNRLTSYRVFNGAPAPDEISTYRHDALDRVVEETEDHTGTANDRKTEFTYLGLTNKVSKEVQRALVGGSLIATKTYNHDAFGNRVGMRKDKPSDPVPVQDFSYSNDVHGSVSLLVDEANGNSTASYAYSPFGEEDPELSKGDPSNTDNLLNPYRYASKRLDTGSDSYDMGARRFGPDVAHFLQQDLFLGALDNLGLSLDPLTQNRYGLAGGNPLSYMEWDGHVVLRDGDAGSRVAQSVPKPVVGLVPGIGGRPDDPHFSLLADLLASKGFDVREFRWCNNAGSDLRACGTANNVDPKLVASALRNWAEDNNVSVLIGHSKGGTIVMQMLGEIGLGNLDPIPSLKRAIAVDAPMTWPATRVIDADAQPLGEGLQEYHKAFPRVDVVDVWNMADPFGEPFPTTLGPFRQGPKGVPWPTPCPGNCWPNPPPGREFFYRVGGYFPNIGEHTLVLTQPCQASSIAELAATGKWGTPMC